MTILILFVSLFVLFLLGAPIAFSLGLSSALALLSTGSNMIVLAQSTYGGLNSFPFLCLPFFILAGNLMASGGISRRLVNCANAFLGHVTGGLAVVAVVACMFFAAVCGSAAATCAAVGAILIPAMNERGYDTSFSSATIATAATAGIIIPPSVPMVIYCVTVGASVSSCFVGGIIPGVVYCGALLVLAVFRCKHAGYQPSPKCSWSQRGRALYEAILPLMMPVIILGGIYGGIFTATEASVVAVVYGLIVSVGIYRELKLNDLKRIFLESASMAGGLLCLLGVANVFGYVLARERIPQAITTFFMGITDNKIMFLLIVNILFLIIGMIMDTSPAIIILAPMLAPVATAYGIDLIHFGVMMILNCAIGMASPPFGLSLFVITEISGSKFLTICRKMVPCFLVMLVVLMLVTYCEPLTTVLINLMNS